MIQTIASLLQSLIKETQVNDHATLRVRPTANDHFRAVGVAMDPTARLGIHCPVNVCAASNRNSLLSSYISECP